MKKRLLFLLLLLQFTLYAQKESNNDTILPKLPNRKISGFLSLINDFTINENQQFSSIGIGGAFLFANKFYFGGYGLGMITSLHRSDILTDNILNNYQLNYAHGGLWLGIIDSPNQKINTSFSIKLGWGALFMYNINSTINYNNYRDEFLVITPQFETGILITNWLKLNIGFGVRFLNGISTLYKDSKGNFSPVYHSSDYEGFITSFTLSFGNFSSKN